MILINGVLFIDTKLTEIKSKTDLTGAITDFAYDKTLLGYFNSLYQHVHKPSKVYPTLTGGVVLTGGAGAWALGDYIQVIPANGITTEFDIHYVNIEAASATDVYELVIGAGAALSEVEIGRIRTHKNSNQSGANNVIVQIPAQLANTRIAMKIASGSGGGDTLTVSVHYHEYS